MPQEHSGPAAKAPWTKIFTAFKVALDLKKITLAAVGIFLVFLGWGLISWIFYNTRGFPIYNVESKDIADKKDPALVQAEWNQFKARRLSWNLLYELAASPSERRTEDAGDIADSRDEFILLDGWEKAQKRLADPIIVKVKEKTLDVPALGNSKAFKWSFVDSTDLEKMPENATLGAIEIKNNEKKLIAINGVLIKVDDGNFKELSDQLESAHIPTQIEVQAKEKAVQQALAKFNANLRHPKAKPVGRLRISPWSEYRGDNPYLVVANTLKEPDTIRTGRSMLHWVFSDRALVLLEPLVKFLLPVVYIFDQRAGGWDRLYLILIVLWTLAVWGFFGGAISRIAAVQIARNERISLGEAIRFTRERAWSFMGAPVFPLALLAIFVFGLMIFGWIEWIPYLGDLWAGLLWPIVLVIGFIMAIVLIGLIGWPLMIATISTEGTDSFDALSRSYSYIYQAPWQYLWYNFLAVVYGAALVFFIGFMASLMVFAGKWSVSSAPGLANSDGKYDREPSYLFYYAPTSYGWRDLLISSNTEHVEKVNETSPDGRVLKRYEFKEDYKKEFSTMNHVGAFLVACWIYPLFLLVLGFSYSYFWTASTIIYFLMRHHVDDTEMDEVHQEDDDLEDPFMKTTPPPAAPPPAAPPSKPGTLSLNVVEAPPAPPPPPTTYITPPSEPIVPPPAPPPAPPPDGHA